MAKKRIRKSVPKKVSALSTRDKSEQFHKLPGKARQYQRGKTGKVISRRHFDALRKREGKPAGKAIAPTFKSERGTKTYWKSVKSYRETLELKQNLKEVANSPGFKTARKNLHSKDLSAHGPKARALEDFGLRERDASYAVGETPKAA